MEALPGGQQAIRATVPLAEALRYATDLKSMTAGRGSYTMEFRSYEPVPAQRPAEPRRPLDPLPSRHRGGLSLDRGRNDRGPERDRPGPQFMMRFQRLHQRG